MIIFIAGPTASGKSRLALELTQSIGGVILNADAMQWYDALPILTSQPSAHDHSLVTHLMYGTRNPLHQSTVALWQQEAISLLRRHHRQNVIIVGGTGLYIRSLTQGLSPIPLVPQAIREQCLGVTKDMTISELRRHVFKQDPLLLESAHPPQDRQRLLRALEVIMATGHSIRYFQGQAMSPLESPHLIIKLVPKPIVLQENINKRIIEMISCGAIEEVLLFNQKWSNIATDVIKTIGYKELCDVISNQLTLSQAIDIMTVKTRQYAKRQLTWFNKFLPQPHFLNPHLDNILVEMKRTRI